MLALSMPVAGLKLDAQRFRRLLQQTEDGGDPRKKDGAP